MWGEGGVIYLHLRYVLLFRWLCVNCEGEGIFFEIRRKTMSIRIKLIKNNIMRSSSYGKYFAKTVRGNDVNLQDLAEEAARNCSLKKSDVIAVVTELEEMMSHRLADGDTIVLKGIGRFSLRVESDGVDDPKDFSIKKHIRRIICRFLPASHRNTDGTLTYNMSKDVKVEWGR